MIASISVGTIICIIAAMAGDTSQDLKTGCIVGATPMLQQIGELLGAVFSAFSIGLVMYLLNQAWGFGSTEIPAPQASLMKMVVEGVMGGTLPWTLIFIGAFIAIAVEVIGIPVLAFAIGLYLPIHLSTPIFIGGLEKHYIESRKYKDDDQKNNSIQCGILYSSGMIAGEGIIGILLAGVAVIGLDIDMSGIYGNAYTAVGNWVGIIAFAVLVFTLLRSCKRR